MPNKQTAAAVLDVEFLPIRAKLLEIAAALDRIDRAAGSAAADRRMASIHEAIDALTTGPDDRAERVQLIFSRKYEDNWREKFGLQTVR